MMCHERHLCKNKTNIRDLLLAFFSKIQGSNKVLLHEALARGAQHPGASSSEQKPAPVFGESLLLWLWNRMWGLVVSGQDWTEIICRDPAAKP